MSTIRNKVMIVDDDPIVLQTVSIALEARRYTVVTRDSPIGTGAAIMSERPEVLILDVQMPGLSGDSLMRLLEKKTDVILPWVIFHSSLPLSELQGLKYRSRAAGVIQKTELRQFLLEFEKLLASFRMGAIAQSSS